MWGEIHPDEQHCCYECVAVNGVKRLRDIRVAHQKAWDFILRKSVIRAKGCVMETNKKILAQEVTKRKGYDELKLFIKGDPLIHGAEAQGTMTKSKKQYYSRFENIARNLAADVGKEYLSHSDNLLSHYDLVKEDIIRKTNIESISLPHSLDSYMKNPLQELTDGIQSYLFDFLQGKTHYDEFAHKATRNIKSRARHLYSCGYDFWVFLSIINQFGPKELYGVEFGPDLNPVAINTTIFKPERQQPITERKIPDMVIKTRAGTLLAVKFEKAAEIDRYGTSSVHKGVGTYAGDPSNPRGHYLMMIYHIPSLSKIPTVVNLQENKVAVPYTVVEVSTEEEMRAPVTRAALGNRAATLNPEKAYNIILPEDTPSRRWFRGDDKNGRKLPRMKYIGMSYQDERLDLISKSLR